MTTGIYKVVVTATGPNGDITADYIEIEVPPVEIIITQIFEGAN